MECCHCAREIMNKGSLRAHEMSCEQNPGRVVHKRGEGAGAQRGGSPWNKNLKIGPNKGWKERFPDEKVFTENSKYPRHCIKRRILQDGKIEYKCSCCGIDPIWNGAPMPLILDHINGKNDDNRIENLRFVCSNCDSQLDTYKARNRRKQ